MWYNIFSTTLEVIGFEIKIYDRCVANKMIEGKYCTIFWYMDDNKLSHKKTNSNIIHNQQSRETFWRPIYCDKEQTHFSMDDN